MVNAFRWMIFVIGLAVVIGSIMVTSVGGLRIEINSPSDDDTVSTDKITVYGRAIMDPSGAVVESVIVRVNDHPHPAYGTPSWHSELISLQPGQNKITAVAIDGSGKSATTPTIYVNYEPTPTSTNESTPVTPPTTITISNGGYRPTPTPTPTPTGSISITTKPSEAEIFWDGVSKGDTPITLEDIVGNHKIEISKEGYRSKNRNINLYEGITKKLNIELKPITGSIYISSTPSGACVYLDGVNRKANTNCTLREVVVGNHTIKLTKPDYFDVVRNVLVSNSSTIELHVNLTGYGSINISSDPPGAKVYLDGNYTGETPMKISKVVVGYHTIKLTKFGYEDAIIRNVSISVGRTHPVHVNLTECGYINIDSEPSGANVFVDGDYMGETSKNITVAQGNHTIKLTKSDYFDEIRNVTVSVGETCHLHVHLAGYGSLHISSYPSKAKIYLDDDYKGKTLLYIPKVVVGSHSIKLTKFGYATVEKNLDVSVGKKETVDETLSILTWWWTLAMILSAIALEEAARDFIRKRIIPFIRSIKEKYLFNWDRVPGDDDEKFKKSLRDYFDIGWAENAKIRKSDDGKTISISKDENSAEIIIDAKKEKASLKITDVQTLNLKVKNENDKLNLYKKKNK